MESIDPSQEVWKPVEGFERYHVSTFGNVKNVESGKMLKGSKNEPGYMTVHLTIPMCSSKRLYCHRLVATTFIPNPYNLPQVDHIDRVRDNNNVNNLRWASPEQQCKNKKISPPISSKHRRAVWKCDKVTGKKIEFFESTTMAVKKVGNTKKSKSQIIVNSISSSKPAYGYKWVYAEPDVITGETWKDIPSRIIGLPEEGLSRFQISDHGRMKNPRGIIRVPFEGPYGYTMLSINGRMYRAHRIVALTFLEKPDGKDIVNHIDGDKTNCKLSNLEWVTPRENNIHAVNEGLIKTVGINQYGLDGTFIKKHQSVVTAHRDLGIVKGNILTSLKTGFTTAGFQWRVAEGNTLPVTAVEDGRYRNCISQYAKDGKFICEYLNVVEASKITDISQYRISKAVITGVLLQDTYFRRRDTYIGTSYPRSLKVVQYTENDEVVEEFCSITSATRKTGHSRFFILKSSSTGITYKGFRWSCEDEPKKRKRED